MCMYIRMYIWKPKRRKSWREIKVLLQNTHMNIWESFLMRDKETSFLLMLNASFFCLGFFQQVPGKKAGERIAFLDNPYLCDSAALPLVWYDSIMCVALPIHACDMRHTHTPTHAHSHTHACTHTYTHIHTHTFVHTHTHTPPHTHTHLYVIWQPRHNAAGGRGRGWNRGIGGKGRLRAENLFQERRRGEIVHEKTA